MLNPTWVPNEPVKKAAFRVLNVLQDQRPEHQLMGMAMALTAICQELNLDAHELVTNCRRRMAEAETHDKNNTIVAIKDFARGELADAYGN